MKQTIKQMEMEKVWFQDEKAVYRLKRRIANIFNQAV